jgi:tetratricopeptide (TPR) repeat protein
LARQRRAIRQEKRRTFVPWSLAASLPPGLPSIHLRKAVLGFLLSALLAACATTEEQRFPLDYFAGTELSYQLDTAGEAFPAYRRMGTELERQGHFGEAAIAYRNASISAVALGRLQDALDAGQRAVAMAERTRKPSHLGITLAGLGWIHINVNAPQKAIPVFERAAQYAKESRNPHAEGGSYSGLSRAHRQLGNQALALENATKAVQVLEAAIPVLTIERRRFGDQGERSLANLERNYADALVQLGWNHFAPRQWDPARAAFQKALDVASRIRVLPVVASAHQGLGTVAARQQDFPTAASHLEEAIRLNPRPAFVAWNQATLGRVYRGMGKLPEAEDALRKAVAGFEDLRNLLGSETLREVFFEDKAETL